MEKGILKRTGKMNERVVTMIKNTMSDLSILEGLAEEAGELSAAALKLARIRHGENPSPKKEAQAFIDLLEEIADVKVYLELELAPIDRNVIERFREIKMNRMAERLGQI